MERADLKNLVLIGLLILAIAYVAWNGFPAFRWEGVAAIRAEAEKKAVERRGLETRVQSAQLQVQNLDKIKKERAALEVQLKEISRRLPGERESAEVLRSVESLAGRSGLTPGAGRRRGGRAPELCAGPPMGVGGGGGYDRLGGLPGPLSQLRRL